MTEPTITCPECQAQIKLTETLAGPVLEAERQKNQKELLERAARLETREQKLTEQAQSLEKAQAAVDRQVKDQVKQATEDITKQAEAKAQQAASQELDAARKQIEANKTELETMRQTELTLRQERQKLQEEREALDLKIQRTLDEERQKIREAAQKDEQDRTDLKMAEKDKVITDMRKQLDEARRKSDPVSSQLQGEVQELSLEATLQTTFPTDIIEPVAKGQHGGDVVQHVVAPDGRRCGTILWESKRTKNWSDQWLQKVRDDQRAAHADLSIIMSTALPSSITNFGQVDGVWITDLACSVPAASALRSTLIQVATARLAVEGHEHKMASMYDYLTGSRFKARVEAMVEAVIAMQSDLDSEKRAITKQWAKREGNMKRLLFGTSGMYGDLQSIVGSTLPQIGGLELDDLVNGEASDPPQALPPAD